MKKDIHPETRDVVFRDSSNGELFVLPSTIQTEKTVEHNGKTYPLVEVEISSSSHPFYTGNEKILDTAGRVEKFKSRVSKSKKGQNN
jgi:large subunit ribosomal protein L31